MFDMTSPDTLPTMAGLKDELVAIYVRLNPEKLGAVTKFGTTSFIAAERLPPSGKLVYYMDRVVPILHDDFRRHRGDYNDAIKSGHLLKANRDEYVKSRERKPEQAQTKVDETKNPGKKADPKKAPKKATKESGAPPKD